MKPPTLVYIDEGSFPVRQHLPGGSNGARSDSPREVARRGHLPHLYGAGALRRGCSSVSRDRLVARRVWYACETSRSNLEGSDGMRTVECVPKRAASIGIRGPTRPAIRSEYRRVIDNVHPKERRAP